MAPRAFITSSIAQRISGSLVPTAIILWVSWETLVARAPPDKPKPWTRPTPQGPGRYRFTTTIFRMSRPRSGTDCVSTIYSSGSVMIWWGTRPITRAVPEPVIRTDWAEGVEQWNDSGGTTIPAGFVAVISNPPRNTFLITNRRGSSM